MFELIPDAMAAAAPATNPAQQESIFSLFIPFILLGLFIWLFLLRPQKRQRQEHAKMINAIKPGDEVVTSGGVIGRVSSLKKLWVQIEVDKDNYLRVQRNAILSVLPRGTIEDDADIEAPDTTKD